MENASKNKETSLWSTPPPSFQTKPLPERHKGLKVFILVALVILGIACYPYLKPRLIHEFIAQHRTSAPLCFIIICALKPVLFFVPSLGLTIIAGTLFGVWQGAAYVIIGGALSTLIGFYFARWIGRDTIISLMQRHNWLTRLDQWVCQNPGQTILYMRIVNLPWDLVSYWAGLSGMPFGPFYLASLIPIVPLSFLYTYCGSQLYTPTSPGFLLSLGLIILLGAWPSIRRYWQQGRRSQTATSYLQLECDQPRVQISTSDNPLNAQTCNSSGQTCNCNDQLSVPISRAPKQLNAQTCNSSGQTCNCDDQLRAQISTSCPVITPTSSRLPEQTFFLRPRNHHEKQG